MKSRKQLESKWRSLIGGWEGSGETQAKYCQRQGVALATFQYWRRKLKGKSDSFIELVPASPEPNGVSEIALELPCGITLKIRG